MNISSLIAKHLREVFFGGNWTVSNLKDQLTGITWDQAITKVDTFNTIAALTYHIGYFTTVQLKVMQGGPLEGDDKYSFDLPPIQSQADWEALVSKTLTEAESLAALIAQFPDSKLTDDFIDKKYGNYYRNFHGLIEHTHYHLGQIALVKKMVKADASVRSV